MTKTFGEWRFSAVETISGGIALATTAVIIAVWVLQTFQSKADAAEDKAQLERRIDSIETDVRTMRASVESVAKDVSYIRGRLEPKQ